jgi:uncharacterized protein (TIGR04222 family)
MNPLDFTGPDFLVFYALYGASICGGLFLLRLTAEPQMPTQAVPADPQTIAYLRGGATEALRISAMTLLERDVLVLDPNDTLRAHAHHKLPADASMIDRAVRDHFRGGASALSLFQDANLALGAQAHAARPLEDAGLMPDDALRDARRRRLIAAVVALGVLAAAKITVALSRGHSNVGLLVIEAAVFGLIACRLTIRHRTPAGDRALKYLTQTFEPVRDRTRSMAHPPPDDIAIVAAVFGLGALVNVPSANVTILQPRKDGSGCGGGCGGDGGGGCGGGCGGCGG